MTEKVASEWSWQVEDAYEGVVLQFPLVSNIMH
jgi:hypothetical protein